MGNEISNQRWLALGLFVFVLLIVVFIFVIPVVSTGMEYYEQKKELTYRLHRSKQFVAKKDNMLVNIERIKDQYQQQNYFSTQDTVALASADLQRFIKTTIAEAGGELTSTQVLPATSEERFNRITVKVRMSGNVDALRSVLHQIESARPIMIIDQIDIRPIRGRRNRRTRQIEPSNKLNVNFQAIGFMRAKTS